MRDRLTTRYVAALKPASKPYQVHDTNCRGFIVRMQPNGTGLYYFMYTAPDKRRHKVPIGRADEMSFADAKKKAEEYRNRVALGGDPVAEQEAEQAEAERAITLRQFVDEKYRPWALANLKSHVSVLKRLHYGFLDLLDKPLADLTPFDFEANRVKRLKGNGARKPKPATVNRDQMTLRAALTKAKDWGLLETNPLDKVKRAKEDRNAAIRAITKEEEAAILEALEARSVTNPPDWYLPPLFVLSLDTGLRKGEATALEWADIDLERKTVTVRGSGAKSSQTRVVPLTARALAAMRAWRENCPEGDAVFPGATDDSIRWQWAGIRDKAGVRGLRWHDLRHSYASRLAHAGCGVLLIKELLGHSSITTSQRYLHAVESDLRRAVDLLEQSNVVDIQAAKGADG